METNNTSPAKKDSIMKSLAIAGFLAILLVVAWLAIQLVHLFPGAFSSLASLAEGVNQNQETIIDTDTPLDELTLMSNTSLLNNGETVTIEWSKVNANGSYIFSYECTDGVAIEHITTDGVRPVNCGTNYNIGDTTNLIIGIESEKNRYADVPYSVAFMRTSDTSPRAMGTDTVTVVNSSINNQFALGPTEVTPVVNEEVSEEVINPVAEPEVVVTPPTPTAPIYTQQYTYAIPVSDPNGTTDLGTSYIGVGEVVNRSFRPGTVSQDEPGAIQFAVQNFGTKTSRSWTFTVDLPTGGTYRSPTQDGLKPNERAVLTIGFPAGASALHTFEVKVEESSDRNSRNDSFKQTVRFSS